MKHVTVCELDSKTSKSIPLAELSPNMVEGRLPDGSVVWVDGTKVNPNTMATKADGNPAATESVPMTLPDGAHPSPNPPRRPRRPATAPSSAAQPREPASGGAAKGKGHQPVRKTPPNNVRQHLSKLSGNLYAVVVDLKGFKNSLQALQNRDRREGCEHAITVLEAAMKQIRTIGASFGVTGKKNEDGSMSVGDLPFTTGIIVRGSSFTRIQRITEVVAAVAESIQKPAPTTAAELQNVAGELEHVLERARSGGGL
ncbi:MAG TPA: hypothetical protein PKI20_11890 [Verrucomicrobiota bacterium]|jgi:hypothetical protein|nr:hypothetical protein [Verrucomicrobiota bacterium]HQL78866.1 hypothetical protein [Verrucomicrobiota bacterium]